MGSTDRFFALPEVQIFEGCKSVVEILSDAFDFDLMSDLCRQRAGGYVPPLLAGVYVPPLLDINERSRCREFPLR